MVNINPSQTKAVIFDMDGTMIANMKFHKLAWKSFLEKHDIHISDDEFLKKISGKKNDQIFKILFGESISEKQIEKYAEEKEVIYRNLYESDITEIDGLSDLIDQLHRYGIKTAIATTAPEANRTFGLNKLGLIDQFEVVLGDEHVSNGKPDPEIYVKTAARLGLPAEKCVVFEDSPPGIASAKNANMRVIAILTSHDKNELTETNEYIQNFRDVTVKG